MVHDGFLGSPGSPAEQDSCSCFPWPNTGAAAADTATSAAHMIDVFFIGFFRLRRLVGSGAESLYIFIPFIGMGLPAFAGGWAFEGDSDRAGAAAGASTSYATVPCGCL